MNKSTAIVAVLGLASVGTAQSTMDMQGSEVERNSDGVVVHRAAEGGLTLATASFFLVEPPEPRVFRENDLITVIVSERSEVANENTLETDTSFDMSGGVTSMPDLLQLLELRWRDYENLPVNVDMNFDRGFSGEGEQEVSRETTARVTARVIEIKPNGTMLLESKTSIRTDGEEQVIVISGLARQEDVTIANTVQSNQMANLIVDIQHYGELKKSAEKGLIPKAFDLLFNF